MELVQLFGTSDKAKTEILGTEFRLKQFQLESWARIHKALRQTYNLEIYVYLLEFLMFLIAVLPVIHK